MATLEGEPVLGATPTTPATTTPPLPDTTEQLFQHRVQKLYRAGFSDEAAREIAKEDYLVIDSDDAIKALRAAEQVYVNAEKGALYLLNLRDNPPARR